MFHQNLLVGLAKDQTTANLTIYTRIFWTFLERTRDQAHSQDCTRHRGSYVRVLRTSLILRAVLWRDRAHFPPQLLPRTLSQLKIRSKSGIGSGGLGRSPKRGPEAKLNWAFDVTNKLQIAVARLHINIAWKWMRYMPLSAHSNNTMNIVATVIIVIIIIISHLHL